MSKKVSTHSSDFKIAETKTFEKSKKKIDGKVYQKIKSIVYPQLRKNPWFGANIKKLKGDFEGYYRYRIGNHRLFYLIDSEEVIIFVIELKHRKRAYS